MFRVIDKNLATSRLPPSLGPQKAAFLSNHHHRGLQINYSKKGLFGCFYKLGVLLLGVLFIRALRFWVWIRAPCFWTLPFVYCRLYSDLLLSSVSTSIAVSLPISVSIGIYLCLGIYSVYIYIHICIGTHVYLISVSIYLHPYQNWHYVGSRVTSHSCADLGSFAPCPHSLTIYDVDL